MHFHYGSYIFLAPGIGKTPSMKEHRTEAGRFKTIGVDFTNKGDVIDIARELSREGVQVIELCGGFGSNWIEQVKVVVGQEVCVGGVYYGPEFREQLLSLTK